MKQRFTHRATVTATATVMLFLAGGLLPDKEALAGIGTLEWAKGQAKGQAPRFDAIAAAADAVIHGTVIAVDYRMSADGDGGLPHAFVTYDVHEVLAGTVESNPLVLRFIGGPDSRGDFLMVGHTPMFDIGNEDILFVRGNGAAGCPLVECEHGRIRIHEAAAYGPHGTAMVDIVHGRAAYRGEPSSELQRVRVPRPRFEDLAGDPEFVAFAKRLTGARSIEALRRRYERETPLFTEMRVVVSDRAGGSGEEWADPRAGVRKSVPAPVPLAAAEVLQAVRTIARQAPAAGAPVRTLDPDRSFSAGGR